MSNPAPGWQKHPDHVVDIQPFQGQVTVQSNDTVIAQSNRAFLVQESRYQPVYYIPQEDVRTELFGDSDNQTYCPFKGHASYYHLSLGDEQIENVAWFYPEPFDECLNIKGYVSFYTDKVTITV